MEIALSTGFTGGDLPDPSSFTRRGNFDDPDGEVGPAGRGYFAHYGFSEALPAIQEQEVMMDIDEEGPVDPDLADMPNAGSLLRKISQAAKKADNYDHSSSFDMHHDVGSWSKISVHDLMLSAAQSEALSDQFQEIHIQEQFPFEGVSFLQDYAMSCACLATVLSLMNHDSEIDTHFIDSAIQSFKRDPDSIQSDEFLKNPTVGSPSHTGLKVKGVMKSSDSETIADVFTDMSFAVCEGITGAVIILSSGGKSEAICVAGGGGRKGLMYLVDHHPKVLRGKGQSVVTGTWVDIQKYITGRYFTNIDTTFVAYFFEPVFGKGKEEEDADEDTPMPDSAALKSAAAEFQAQAAKISASRRVSPSEAAGSKVRGKVQNQESAKDADVPLERVIAVKKPVEGLDSFAAVDEDASSSSVSVTPTSQLLSEMNLDEKKDAESVGGGVVFEPEEVVENKRRRPQAAPGSPMRLSGDESDEKRAKTPPRASSPPLGEAVSIPAASSKPAPKRASGAKLVQKRLSKNAATQQQLEEDKKE